MKTKKTEIDGIKITESKSTQLFGTDALMLSAYVRKNPGAAAAELGAGSGAISVILALRGAFKSIKAVEIRLKSKFDWKPLRNYCTSHELEMPKIFDANYGSVRTYPAEAWQAIYGVDLKELF